MNSIRIAAAAALALCISTSTRARADDLGDEFRGHLVVSLGVGIGTLSPSQYNSNVDTFNANNGPVQGDPAHVGSELHVPVLATIYFPYFLLFRTGVEAAYFFPSETLTGANSETVTNYGGILEVPLEIGGHMSFLDKKLVVEAALGPAIAAYTSAGLSGSANTSGPHMYGDPTVGFDDEVKAQYFLTPGFSLGLELGYRKLTTSQLHDGNGNPQTQNGQPLQLDMSGFRAVFEMGFVAF